MRTRALPAATGTSTPQSLALHDVVRATARLEREHRTGRAGYDDLAAPGWAAFLQSRRRYLMGAGVTSRAVTVSDTTTRRGASMITTKLQQAWSAPTSGQRVAEAYTRDGVRIEYAKPGARLAGREAIAQGAQRYLDAVPDSVLDIRHVHEADGTITLEWTYRGTHTGDVEGFPARGEAIHLDGVSVLTIEDGLVREERVYWDAATLFGLMD